MKTATVYLLCLTSLSCLAQHDVSTLNQEALEKTKLFASQLKSTLQAGVKQGGLAQGVNVCKDAAPSIAQAHAVDGWQVGRTSLKLRNSNNQADEWESKQLAIFEEKIKAGANPKTLMANEVVTSAAGDKQFRFMKAIPTGKLCLNCHGSKIAPKLKSAINQHYPEDKAIGFNLGDLRGAFTLTKSLPN